MRKFIFMTVALLVLGPAAANAVDHEVRKVTGFRLWLYPPTAQGGTLLGILELTNGQDLAGYIYLDDQRPVDPFLGSTRYIVATMPTAWTNSLLDVLRNEKNVVFEYYHPQTEGSWPRANLSAGNTVVGATASPFPFDKEQAPQIQKRLHQK